MTPHERARELAAVAIDFELDDLERRELERHLATCDACRAHSLGLSADAGRLAALPGVDAPYRLRQAVLSGRSLPLRARFGPAVAALVLIVVTGLPLGAGILLFRGIGGGAGAGGAPILTPWASGAIGAPTPGGPGASPTPSASVPPTP